MLTLTLPLPPAEFSLNSRRHWTIKEKVRLEAQSAVMDALIATNQAGVKIRNPKAKVLFCFATKQRKDHDNLIPRLKPYWDALVFAGVIEDDSIYVLGWPEFSHMEGKKPGYVRIEIMERE